MRSDLPLEKGDRTSSDERPGRAPIHTGRLAIFDADHIWNEEPPKVLERSRLYHLEPIGRTTGEVESATSFLARLAAHHTVSTWSLLRAGEYPSQYRVRRALPKSIDMRDPPANKAWKQTLVELGLTTDNESTMIHTARS